MKTLDKEEFRIKLEEINKLVQKKDYKGAMGIVDSIDWRRVKNVRTLCVVGEIYAANGRYEDSKEIFLLAYHKASIGKNILYRLIEISLRMKDIDEAMEFFEEYKQVASNDSTQYILQYKIARAQDASLNEQIRILEEYKEQEFTEKWSYELAALYYKAGEKQKALDLCNEIILWFSEGKYVMKAYDLKMRMGELTGAEKAKFEQQFVPKLLTPEEAKELKKAEAEKAEKTENTESEEAAETSESSEISGNPESGEAQNSDSTENTEGYREKEETGSDAEAQMNAEISKDKTENPETEDVKETAEEAAPIHIRDLNSMENIQEKISKGIRDIFGANRKREEEYGFGDESHDLVNEAGITKEEEIPEEIIKSDASEKEPENVPTLEAEPVRPGESPVIKAVQESSETEKSAQEEPEDFSRTMRMPELKIPASMKNMELSTAPKVSEIPKTFLSGDSADGVPEFNLEDTILAAATAQGIEIPKEKKKETEKTDVARLSEEVEKAADKKQEDRVDMTAASDTGDIENQKQQESAADLMKEPELEEPDFLNEDAFEEADDETEDAGTVTKVQENLQEPASEESEVWEKTVPGLEDEEELTEEDLRSAEEEFLHGPAGKGDFNLEDIDDSEEEPEELVEPEAVAEPEEPADASEDEEETEEEPLTQEEELERFIESINPKNQADPRDIIPREKELTDEEKQLFTYFTKVPGMKEQLIDALCDAQLAAADKTSKTGNLIVMGGKECGKTRLISGLIPAICKELNLEASKVAYVFADQINGKNIYKIFSKLAGGFLVIENANQLTPETVEMLDKAMEVNTDGLTVIIEDEKIGMRKLMARFPKFAKKFTSMINIPVFTNDELVNFARVYTKENGYTIDQMGMLALYNLIGINQKEDEPMNVGAVKDLIDTAIAKSQGGIRKLKRNISKKRTDRDGYIVLYEKDFSK